MARRVERDKRLALAPYKRSGPTKGQAMLAKHKARRYVPKPPTTWLNENEPTKTVEADYSG